MYPLFTDEGTKLMRVRELSAGYTEEKYFEAQMKECLRQRFQKL